MVSDYFIYFHISADTEQSPSSPVLDLPPLHTKPSALSLLETLSCLSVKPTSWDETRASENLRFISEDGVPSYLTRIIASPLSWIVSEEVREEIWRAASARLAERSGRSALPSLTRTFKIPAASSNKDQWGSVEIRIHEPSLTGDNLGHKTWVASYLLAKRLPDLFHDVQRQMSSEGSPSAEIACQPRRLPTVSEHSELTAADQTIMEKTIHPSSATSNGNRLRVLELGAGTGLVGLAAAASFSINAYLTDVESIVGNLQHNIQENRSLTEQKASIATAGVLDWSTNHPEISEDNRYHLILAADSLYAPHHAEWLARTMDAYLIRSVITGRIFLELPFRETHPPEHEQLRQEMGAHFFELESEGEEIGLDDWEENLTGEKKEVKCWWSVWKRSGMSA